MEGETKGLKEWCVDHPLSCPQASQPFNYDTKRNAQIACEHFLPLSCLRTLTPAYTPYPSTTHLLFSRQVLLTSNVGVAALQSSPSLDLLVGTPFLSSSPTSSSVFHNRALYGLLLIGPCALPSCDDLASPRLKQANEDKNASCTPSSCAVHIPTHVDTILSHHLVSYNWVLAKQSLLVSWFRCLR